MKILSKITFLLVFLFCINIAHSQTYRIEAGYITPKKYGADFSTTYFNGIRFGGTVEFGLKKNFSLLTGALYSFVYSNKVQNYSSSDSVRYTTFGHSLDIPLQLVYTQPLSKTLKIFGYAGPNFNIGLAQPQKIDAILSDEIKAITSIESNNYDLYKASIISRMNYQLSIGAGIQWKNYRLKGGYDFGIKSINKVDTSNLYQSGWHVSIAFEF